MREILFRGKRLDNGEWVEGSLWTWGKNVRIHLIFDLPDSALWFRVDPSTVGQYTGMNIYGKKIFEGDIVRITERGRTADGGVVEFRNGYPGGWLVVSPTDTSSCSLAMRTDVEVIGNIHDNPELLKGE